MISSQQKRSPTPAARKLGRTWPLVASSLGVAIVIGTIAFFALQTAEPEKTGNTPKRAAKIVSVQPTIPSAPKSQPKVEMQEPNKRYEDGVEVVKYAASTNNSGAVIEKLTLADGRKISKIHPPKPVFENPADQIIALAVSVKPGESMPPFPNLSGIDEDFAKSLLSPIKINDDDPDDTKELKAKVIEAKAYLIDDIKNGGSVLDALLTHQKEMEKIADGRLMAIQEMQKIQAEGDAEMARDFAIQVNESFKARGIPEIPVPDAK